MKFLVVAIAQCSSGGLSILKDFYSYIKEHSEDEWEFWLSGDYVEETNNIKIRRFDNVKKSRFHRLYFDLISGRKEVSNDIDAVLYLQNNLIYGINVPQILYMDQAIPFQQSKRFSFFKNVERGLALYQTVIGMLIKDACKKADYVIAQTQWIKDAIVEQCCIEEARVRIISPDISIPVDLKEKEVEFDSKTFFYPATDLIYKNHAVIEEAVNIVKRDCTYFNVLLTIDETEVRRSSQYITYGGMIPRNEVYKKMMSSTLIFPSYIESYGMPLAEARAVGTLVLASNTEFSRELLRGYSNAYFFEYDDPAELAALMLKVINREIERKDEPVLRVAGKNSWGKVVSLLQGR